MRKNLLVILVCLFFVPLSRTAHGKDIILHVGESYSSKDDNIVCMAGKGTAPLTIKDCQIWEEFGEVCLYEKKILSMDGVECEEKCQHWDKFNKVCNYETSCRFYPDHNAFIHKTCVDFDSFNNVCRREKEHQIGKD